MSSIIKDGNYETGLGGLGTDGSVYSVKFNETDGGLLVEKGVGLTTGLTDLNIINDGNYNRCLCGIDSTDNTSIIPVQVGNNGELLLEI